MLRVVIVALVVGFVVSFIGNACTTVFLHRSLAHRALVLRRPAVEAFRLLQWITTGIRPRQWVAVHRKHHAFTDIPGDPHSPVLLGWWRVQMRNVQLYRHEARNPDTIVRYAKDIRTLVQTVVLTRLLGLTVGVPCWCWFRPVVGLLRGRQRQPVPALRGGECDRPTSVAALPHGAGTSVAGILTAARVANNHHAATPSAKRRSVVRVDMVGGGAAVARPSWQGEAAELRPGATEKHASSLTVPPSQT